jgi:hypothetical protein
MIWQGMEMAWEWKGLTMAWKGLNGMAWKWKWNDNGMTWKGMAMEMAWKWHGINKFLGLGLGGSFVSLCALTQKLGRNVQ